MSEEHDAWFKDAFGVDLGAAVGKIKDVAGAVINEAKGVEAQVNIENIFNADYFPMTNGDNNIAPGAPRSIKAQLRFGF